VFIKLLPCVVCHVHHTDDVCCYHCALTHTQIGGRDVPSVHGASYGQGVYTATTSAVAQGVGAQTRSVILSRALQGTSGTSHTDTAAHSWTGGANCIVFKDSAQLLPVFVVHY
jgi:hypothetical protein